MEQKISYVNGILFDSTGARVAMVKKTKPAWQAGRFNCIGGKIEPGESPLEAMRREFQEETGVLIEDWNYFTQIVGEDFICHFFVSFSDEIDNVRTIEEEEIHVRLVSDLPENIIYNLKWLIPLALDRDSLPPLIILERSALT